MPESMMYQKNWMLIVVAAVVVSSVPVIAGECDDSKTVLPESLAQLKTQRERLVRMKPQPGTDAAICRTVRYLDALLRDLQGCEVDLFDMANAIDATEEAEKTFHCQR